MASNLYNLEVGTPDGVMSCRAECGSDHQGNGAMAFYPPADASGEILAKHQGTAIETLWGEFNKDTGREIENASVYWGGGGNDLAESKVGFDPAGKISYEVAPEAGQTKTIDQASDHIQQLHQDDVAHGQNSLQPSIAPHNEPSR